MLEFQYNLPVNILFGRGKSDSIGQCAAPYGKRALIVTGGNSTKRSGLLEKTERLLHAAGITTVLFDKVTPNPLTTTVLLGAELANRENCDLVVAIGGGSSIDCAKGIAFQAKNGGDINDYIFGRKTSAEALPLIAVPTTCGTGSEGNGFSVMTNPETNDKKSLRCNAIVPAVSIVDPLLMMTMPKDTLATVGFDALCHNTEAYLSAICKPLTRIQALEGFRLAAESLPRVYNDPEDLDAWDDLSLASTLGGMVIHTAGVVAVHSLEHPASGLRDIVHGKGLAALAPVIYEEAIPYAPEKFAVLARLLGGADEKDFVPKLRELLRAIGLSTTLGQQGILESDIPWMADNCMKVSAAGLSNHPIVYQRDDVARLFRKAL